MMNNLNNFLVDLKIAKELIYDPYNFEFKNLLVHSESIEYGACTFELEGKKIQHRASKITPTKNGQFVTLWKRNQNGITEPFDINDEIHLVIITTRKDNNLGQFIFPKKVLVDNQIISQNDKYGKRGFRVYPPWDKPESKQAEKTQNWQLNYFIAMTPNEEIHPDLLKKLFNFYTQKSHL